MTDSKAERVQHLLLFLWESDDGQHFAEVTDLENDGSPLPDLYHEGKDRVRSYESGIAKGVRPGQILKYDMSPDGKTVYYNKKGHAHDKYVGTWENKSDVARWRAEQEAADADRRAKKSLEGDSKRKYHLEALDDLRASYHKLPSPARAQLLALVVRYIVS